MVHLQGRFINIEEDVLWFTNLERVVHFVDEEVGDGVAFEAQEGEG